MNDEKNFKRGDFVREKGDNYNVRHYGRIAGEDQRGRLIVEWFAIEEDKALIGDWIVEVTPVYQLVAVTKHEPRELKIRPAFFGPGCRVRKD